MEERCDGRSGNTAKVSQNLEQTFTVGTWNVRSYNPKEDAILEALGKKGVDICGFQETKRDQLEDIKEGYQLVFFDRLSKHHGQGFAIREGIKVLESDRHSDRICTITIQKKTNWCSASPEGSKMKLYQINKKRNQLTIVNCYAPIWESPKTTHRKASDSTRT